MDEKSAFYLELLDRASEEIQLAENIRRVIHVLSKYISQSLEDDVQYAYIDRLDNKIYESAVINSSVRHILPFFLDNKFIAELMKLDWKVIDPRGARLLFQKLSNQDIDFETSFLIIPKKRGKFISHFSVLWGGKKLEKIEKEDIEFIKSLCNFGELKIRILIQLSEKSGLKDLKRSAFELKDLSGIGVDLTALGKEDFFGSMLLNVMGRALCKSAVIMLSTNENNTEYRVVASRGILKQYIEKLKLTNKMLIVRELKRTKDAIVVMDILDKLTEDERETINKLEAVIFVPLVSKGEVIGILTLGERMNFQPYSEKVLESIKILSNQMVMAIENSRLSNIRYAFSRYVSHQLVDNIISNPGSIKLGGEKRRVAVLFADIRSFTTMTEKMKPEDVVDLLNTYLSGLSEIVFKYEGTVDKYIGDCVMAVFGAPIAHDNDVERAIFSAIEMQVFVEDINNQREKLNQENVRIGIGINYGEVIAGNMGSMDRMDYTVIGDVVNTASRLEGLAKGGQILVTRPVYDEVKYLVEGGFVDRMTVKGKEKPIDVYEIRDLLARKYLKALEKREPYIIGHFLNIAEDAAKIAKKLSFKREDIAKLKAAAMLIDIGRIGLDEKIFNKKGKFTPKEYEIVKSHVLRGAEYAEKRLKLFKEGIEVIKYHHECYDGSGYPDGLKGDNIPLWARIVGMVDAFNALIARRPHREPVPPRKAIDMLLSNKGKCYDPELVDIYVDILREKFESSMELTTNIASEREVVDA
ncbi:MAG: hypothetical protein DRP84_03275 [Spirochaetes bacterium]|nr:MAG: hypothetical protein DRP84_03275 [Spirochaetota bacterium]